MSAGAVRIAQALRQATARLALAGVEAPRLDARLLLGSVVPGGMAALLGSPERELSAAEAEGFARLLARREAREPVSHLLGRREFWSLEFAVSAAVLDPRPDSETLIGAVLAEVTARTEPLRILDLGTGSGCLLLALLSELPAAFGLGIDASAAALDIAEQNATALGLGARARFERRDWRAAEFALGLAGPFEIVIANPPYIPEGEIAQLAPEVAHFEPRAALDGGADGLDAYRALGPWLERLLAPSGIVAFEIGAGQAAAVAAIIAEHAAALGAPRHFADLGGIERCLLWRLPGKPRSGA